MTRPITSRTTAIDRERALSQRRAGLSGADTSNTIAAAAIDPTPAKRSAEPTALCPDITAAIPTPATIARKVVEALVEREQLVVSASSAVVLNAARVRRLVQVSDSIVKM